MRRCLLLVICFLALWPTISAQEQTNGSKTKHFASVSNEEAAETSSKNHMEQRFEKRALGCNGATDACGAVTEGFDVITTLVAKGWIIDNRSSPAGVSTYFQGNPAVFNAFSGATDSYIAVNFQSVAGANTISNWLISPNQFLQNGDIVSFYTSTVSTALYPDRLQLRLSQNGASTNVGTTATSVGDFTTVLEDINPSLTTTGYPTVWTQYSITLSGLPASGVSGRFAFRYFVPNGGPSGINSDYIGIDSFVYTPVNSFFVCSGGLCIGSCTPSCAGKSCGVSDGCGGLCNVACTASDQCHNAGVCNPAIGCSNPAKTDGTGCNDGNSCTQTDTCQAGVCTGGNPVPCGTSGCVVGSGCINVPPQVSSASTVSASPVSVLLPVSVQFTLSDVNGDSSSIVIDWGDGTVQNFPGPYTPGAYTLGSHTYANTGTYCIKICADDGIGAGSCNAAFMATLVCSKKRASAGSAFSVVVTRFSAGGDPYYLGYDGKTFEFHGNPGEVYNLISSATLTDNIWLNVQFGNGVASDHIHSMGVVMRSIGLLFNQFRILFTVDEKGNVRFNLNGNEITSARNETTDGVNLIFDPNVNFTRTALHMSAHEVHHQLLVKTAEMAIRMFGVRYQPPAWNNVPTAPYFHFVDLEANIIDPTFCPDGIWGRTACGGHHDPKIDYRYRIRGDDLLTTEFDRSY